MRECVSARWLQQLNNTLWGDAGTWLVLDGEEIPCQRVYAEVHKGLCRVVVA